jgi:hypothetical protein
MSNADVFLENASTIVSLELRRPPGDVRKCQAAGQSPYGTMAGLLPADQPAGIPNRSHWAADHNNRPEEEGRAR